MAACGRRPSKQERGAAKLCVRRHPEQFVAAASGKPKEIRRQRLRPAVLRSHEARGDQPPRGLQEPRLVTEREARVARPRVLALHVLDAPPLQRLENLREQQRTRGLALQTVATRGQTLDEGPRAEEVIPRVLIGRARDSKSRAAKSGDRPRPRDRPGDYLNRSVEALDSPNHGRSRTAPSSIVRASRVIMASSSGVY